MSNSPHHGLDQTSKHAAAYGFWLKNRGLNKAPRESSPGAFCCELNEESQTLVLALTHESPSQEVITMVQRLSIAVDKNYSYIVSQRDESINIRGVLQMVPQVAKIITLGNDAARLVEASGVQTQGFIKTIEGPPAESMAVDQELKRGFWLRLKSEI